MESNSKGRRCLDLLKRKEVILTGEIMKDHDAPNIDIAEDSKKINFKVGDYWFWFDKEGFAKFIEEFWNYNETQNILIFPPYLELAYETKNGMKKKFFHRELMKEQIKEYSIKNKISIEQIEVHHKNGNYMDNRKSNLLVLSKKEHRKIHSEWDNRNRNN